MRSAFAKRGRSSCVTRRSCAANCGDLLSGSIDHVGSELDRLAHERLYGLRVPVDAVTRFVRLHRERLDHERHGDTVARHAGEKQRSCSALHARSLPVACSSSREWLCGQLVRSGPYRCNSQVCCPNGQQSPALASRKERSGYRNLILTISPRKKRRRRNSPNAETANHDHPRHAHAPSAGVRRPRMSRLGGKATAVLASLLRFNVAWVRGRSGIRRPAGVGRRFDVSGGVVCPRHLGNVTRARMVA